MSGGVLVEVEFLHGFYEGALDRAGTPDPFPDPGRVFMALRAGAANDSSACDALNEIAAGTPVVVVPSDIKATNRTFFQPVPNPSDSPTAREAHRLWAKSRTEVPWTYLPEPVGYWWPHPNPVRASGALSAAAANTTHVGRATSSVLVTVRPADRPDGGWQESRAGTRVMRLPEPGTVDALDAAWEAGQPADVLWRKVAYAPVKVTEPETSPTMAAKVWRVTDGPGDPMLAGRVLDRIGGAGQSVPAVHVGHRHSDGRLLGAIAYSPDPTGLPDTGSFSIQTTAGTVNVTAVAVDDHRNLPAGLRPDRWTGPSTRWATATPLPLNTPGDLAIEEVVLAGTPDGTGGRKQAARVAGLVAAATGTVPVTVDVSRFSFTPGPRPAHKGTVHALIEFPSIVHGPLCLNGSVLCPA